MDFETLLKSLSYDYCTRVKDKTLYIFVSRNGCDKTGLYCVVEATIERLKIEQDVGIQQIIKQMRSRRPQIIPCIVCILIISPLLLIPYLSNS